MYLDLIKGYRVTIGGYNAPLKEHTVADPITGATLLGALNQESFCVGI